MKLLNGIKKALIATCMVVAAQAAMVVAAQAASSQTLKVVMHSDLKSVEPTFNGAYISRSHGFLIFDQLVARDAAGAVRPQMADSWDVAKDGKTWTFTLRDGLAWHDGAPVTSEDCIASIRRYMKRDGTGRLLEPVVKEFVAVNAKTFRIVLNKPYGMLLDVLSKPSLSPIFMMPKRIADTPATEALGADQMIGSGPYMFKRDEWRPGEKVVYVKNTKYRPRTEAPSAFAGGKVAHLDRIEWIAIADSQTALSALERGEVDLIESVPPELASTIAGNRSLKVKPSGMYSYFFRTNWQHPPFDNPKIRLAAMMALDQAQILKGMIGNPNSYRPCYSAYACNSPFASDAGMNDLLRGDAKRAQALLKEAGYDGTPVVMLAVTDNPYLNNLGPLIKQQLERAGFKVQVAASDWQSLVMRLSRKDKPSEGGWSAYAAVIDVSDAQNPVDSPLLNTNCKVPPIGAPCDDRITDLRDAFASASEPAERQRIARDIQQRNAEVAAYIPLGQYRRLSAQSVKVEQTFDQPFLLFWGLRKAQ